MTTIVGRNVKVQVALTFSAAANPTGVSKANPAVATLAAHGRQVGDVGFWSVSAGMTELDQQAVVVTAAPSGTFDMAGLDSTGYSTYTAGSITFAATWGTVSEAAGYTVGGGAANQLDDTRIMDVKTRNVAGMLPSQDLSIDVKQQEINGAAMSFIESAAKNGTPVLIKITRGNQVLRVAYGVPSIPGESAAAGALATGQFNIVCPAWVLKPNA